MNYIDVEIVTSAEEDYTEVYSLISYIGKELAVDYSKAADIFFHKCAILRNSVPLEMFASEQIYGEMKHIAWRVLSVAEIANNLGQIAGPPYFYVHVNSSEDFGYYINLVKLSIKK